jgi:hypothetical protein
MQSKHVAIDAPLVIALVQLPPSKFGHVAGQPIPLGVIPAESHFVVILSDIFCNAIGSFPPVSHAGMLLPPGALAPLPAFTDASLHF